MLQKIDAIVKLTQCKARDPPAEETMIPQM